MPVPIDINGSTYLIPVNGEEKWGNQATIAFQALGAVSNKDYTNAIFVSKNGNDSNTGLGEYKAKLTFQSAITAVEALATPTSRPIVCLDGGTYNENITTTKAITLFAPNATLTGNITIGLTGSSIQLNNLNGTITCTSGTCYFDLHKWTYAGTMLVQSNGTIVHLHVRVVDGTSIGNLAGRTTFLWCDTVGSTTQSWLGTIHREILDVANPGAGDVIGPAGATADSIALFNGVTGTLLKSSSVLIDNSTIKTVTADTALGITIQPGDSSASGVGALNLTGGTTVAAKGGTITLQGGSGASSTGDIILAGENVLINNTANKTTLTAQPTGTVPLAVATTGYADGKVTQVITNGITNKSPSEDAVFDALALKINTSTQDLTSLVDRDNLEYRLSDTKWINRINPNVVSGNMSGFNNPENVVVTYSTVTRKITLTGTWIAYWQGKPVTEIDPTFVTGWVSAAHTATPTGTQFLYFNGTSFVFDQTPWTFDMVMIAAVVFDSAGNYIWTLRETHGLMDRRSHEEFHRTIGAFLKTGGDLAGYTLASSTAADRRPSISETIICDEDLPTTNPALADNGPYQILRFAGAGQTITFDTDYADIIPVTGSTPIYNQFTGGAWQQTNFTANHYAKIFVMATPVANDATVGQKREFAFIQPQTTSATLATIQALSPSSLNLGAIATLSAEFVYIAEIIVRFAAGNWTLISVNKLTGTKISQVATPAGNFLSTVAVDGVTVTGDGTVASPLKAPLYFSIGIRGSAVAGVNQASFTSPIAGTFSTFYMKVGTAPTGATLIADVNKNGTSLWATTTANRPTIAISGTSATSGALDTSSVAVNDTMIFDIDQVGSTIAGGSDIWFNFSITPT